MWAWNSRSWTQSTVTEYDDDEHNDQSYKIHIRKTSTIVMRTTRHVKLAPISSEQYL